MCFFKKLDVIVHICYLKIAVVLKQSSPRYSRSRQLSQDDIRQIFSPIPAMLHPRPTTHSPWLPQSQAGLT